MGVNLLEGTHTYVGNVPGVVRFYAFNGCGADTAEYRITSLWASERGSWRVYPNPALQRLFVEVPSEEGQGEVRLYTIVGQEVRRWSVQPGLQSVSLEGVPRGLYLLQLRGRSGVHSRKLIVE